MKLIKGNIISADWFEYEVNGEWFDLKGELFLNKKKSRYEHIHIGPRGGEYLIVFNLTDK